MLPKRRQQHFAFKYCENYILSRWCRTCSALEISQNGSYLWLCSISNTLRHSAVFWVILQCFETLTSLSQKGKTQPLGASDKNKHYWRTSLWKILWMCCFPQKWLCWWYSFKHLRESFQNISTDEGERQAASGCGWSKPCTTKIFCKNKNFKKILKEVRWIVSWDLPSIVGFSGD